MEERTPVNCASACDSWDRSSAAMRQYAASSRDSTSALVTARGFVVIQASRIALSAKLRQILPSHLKVAQPLRHAEV